MIINYTNVDKYLRDKKSYNKNERERERERERDDRKRTLTNKKSSESIS